MHIWTDDAPEIVIGRLTDVHRQRNGQAARAFAELANYEAPPPQTNRLLQQNQPGGRNCGTYGISVLRVPF
jgi:hypothetical protein